MKRVLLKLLTTFAEVLAIVSFMGIFAMPVPGQARSTRSRPTSPPVATDADKSQSDESRPFASIAEEMRAKNAIKAADKAYRDNLERARDLSFLTDAVITSYKQKRTLDRDDIKNLEKAEKLAKRIREAAGGSEDDTKIEKPPHDLASALTLLGELSESLKVKVEKTPKHVVSAAVIDEANVLLEVIRLVRVFSPTA